MIECRAVKSDELDPMLSLMCDAFGLPYAPARELFYKDPYFDVNKKRVLTVDGKIASCLTLVDAPMWIGNAPVNVAGVAGVSTASEHRRKGYAARLLIDTLPAIRDSGRPFAALFPFSYDYYRKLGWEQVGNQYLARVARASLPNYSEARYVRMANPSDRKAIANLYEKSTSRKSGRWIRDERRWSYLIEHSKSQVVFKRGDVGGYALFEARDDDAGSRVCRILEMFADTPEARRGLLGFFAQMNDAREVSYTGTLLELDSAGLLTQVDVVGDNGPRLSAEPGVMFRIVDLPSALTALAPNFEGWYGDIILTLTDLHVPKDWPHAARLIGDSDGIRVEALAAGDRLLSSKRRIDGDVRAWSQVLTGYHSLSDSLSLNRLHAFSPDAVEVAHAVSPREMFPRRDLFVPPADHF
jgi:predicted acetyltransferase